MSVLIALDAGHGMNTAGKRTPIFPDGPYKGTFMHEREFNADVLRLLSDKLTARGIRVINVSPEDNDVPLRTRTDRANAANADYFVSIHANAINTKPENRDKNYSDFNTAKGVETFIYTTIKDGSETYRFGESVHKYLIKSLSGRVNRGLKRGDLHVVRETKMPACLVECAFMTNYEEANLLKTLAYREKCATGIYQGICSFLNITFEQVVVTPPPVVIEQPKQTEPVNQHWGEPLIQRMIQENIIGSYHNPTDTVTWAELAATVLNLYDRKIKLQNKE